MAIIYKHPETKETKTVSFPIFWLFTPICALDLLIKGKILHGLLAIIPLFAFIWCFQYKSILSSAYEAKGYERV